MQFADPAVERAFRDDHAVATKILYRAAAALGLVGWCAIGLIDHKVGGSAANAAAISWWRFAVVAPAVAAMLAWGFVPHRIYRHTHELALALGVFVMLSGITVISLRVPEPGLHAIDQAMGGFMLISMGGATITGLRVVPAMCAIVPAALGFLLALAHSYPYAAPTGAVWLGVCVLTSLVASQLLESLRRRAWSSARELARERERSEALLKNLLPDAIAERLKRDPSRIADRHDAATVLFADIVGFTPLAGRVPPDQLVAALDDIFSRFDALAEAHGLEKIKTMGDSYMVVGGVPTPRADHARAVASMALAMRDAIATRGVLQAERLSLRIGIHSGPVIAGVIGKKKLVYDLWGDTVNVASRMESHGVEDAIQVTEATKDLIEDAFLLEARGAVSVKGKGEMRTWLLLGPRREK